MSIMKKYKNKKDKRSKMNRTAKPLKIQAQHFGILLLVLTLICGLGMVFILHQTHSNPNVDEYKNGVQCAEAIARIDIRGNDELAAHERVTGNGTWDDPYVIENYEITNQSDFTGILLECIDKPLIVRNCTIRNRGRGISIYNVSHAIIENNTIKGNEHYGIFIDKIDDDHSFNITFSDNYIKSNDQANIFMKNAANCTFIGNILESSRFHLEYLANNNTITENIFYSYVLRIYSTCTNNLIYNNYFMLPITSAFDDGVNNRWDNGSLGNYWRDYEGTDVNGSGIGTTPYNISGTAGSQDHYPIVLPQSPYDPIFDVNDAKLAITTAAISIPVVSAAGITIYAFIRRKRRKPIKPPEIGDEPKLDQ
ncbi:MAG: hypothetical protein EU548_09255 [Promethearchaeota archaeon]|nr:MAG: hypothetical protein EU548_09255 [Candidatus Lokiarchaeota archaeon]